MLRKAVILYLSIFFLGTIMSCCCNCDNEPITDITLNKISMSPPPNTFYESTRLAFDLTLKDSTINVLLFRTAKAGFFSSAYAISQCKCASLFSITNKVKSIKISNLTKVTDIEGIDVSSDFVAEIYSRNSYPSGVLKKSIPLVLNDLNDKNFLIQNSSGTNIWFYYTKTAIKPGTFLRVSVNFENGNSIQTTSRAIL